MTKTEPSDMRKAHQAVLMELWHVVDAICRKNGIPYMLFAGSALGAVRHGGIIPWDDDLDVVMLRPDYDRFLEAARQELPDPYFLQAEFSAHWPMFFSKIRKNGTACMERFIPKDRAMHQGIYIDIFPCDNLSDRKIMRGLQFIASKFVIAKALDARGYQTKNPVKRAVMAISRGMPCEALRRFVQMRENTKTKDVHTFFGGAKRYKRNVFPRAWFGKLQYMPFGDALAPVSTHYDALLTRMYGDYRTPTPPAQRASKVHADLVDTEHTYEDYLEMQAGRKITVRSKSMR